jgi:exodeoxyribonuclease VII large subunit
LSVGDLTAQIKRLLEGQVGRVWVTGEITNLRAQSSGHIYFTLKDAAAQISCVLFRGTTVADRSLLQDGQKLVVQGEISVYEPRGQYQIIVQSVELQGVGALQAAFERLKQKLSAEGLFAPERKRPLPDFPRRIGLVTSPTGAAIRDVIHVIQRRNPALELVLVPCRVQGAGAAGEIAAAIRLLNEFNESRAREKSSGALPAIDLVLITRGGGSLEDLWAFNEEAVARAIFESALPVVSAVGHEIDFTISDFVADFRAATPSAAAEILTAGAAASHEFIARAPLLLRQRVRRQMQTATEDFNDFGRRLIRLHPRRRLNDWMQRLDDLQSSVQRSLRRGAQERQVALRGMTGRLWRTRPAQILSLRRDRLAQDARRLKELMARRVDFLRQKHSVLAGRLRLLGPEQVLARGYSITMDAETGALVRDDSQTEPGQKLRTRLYRGEILSRVYSDGDRPGVSV